MGEEADSDPSKKPIEANQLGGTAPQLDDTLSPETDASMSDNFTEPDEIPVRSGSALGGVTLNPNLQKTTDGTNTLAPTQSASEPLVKDDIAAEITPMPPHMPVPTQDRAAGGKKGKLIKTLLLILLLAGLVAGAWWVWQEYIKADSTTSQAEQVKKDVPLIRYGITSAGENLNEFYPMTSNYITPIEINQNMYEGLVRFEDQSKLVPALATTWTNPDEKTWVFELKQGVKFHTGNTMKAEDVVSSYETLKALVDDEKASYRAELATSTIDSLVATSEYTVTITTTKPDRLLLNRLTMLPIMDHTGEGKADPLYATGPYQLKSDFTPTPNEVQMVAFDDYHGGHVYTREVHFLQYVPEGEETQDDVEKRAYQDLKDDKLDMLGYLSGKEGSQMLKTAESEGNHLFTMPDTGGYYIGINSVKKDSPLSQLKVRQALNEALDVEVFVKNVANDPESAQAADQFVTETVPGYNPDIKRPAYNLDHAKELLKEAGYSNGFTVTLPNDSSSSKIVDELNRQWEVLGVKVEIEVFEINQLSEAIINGESDLFFIGMTSDLMDVQDVLTALGPAVNGLNYQNDEVAELIEQASITFDESDRIKLLQDASKKMLDDVAYIPVYNSPLQWITDQAYTMPIDGASLPPLFYKVHL